MRLSSHLANTPAMASNSTSMFGFTTPISLLPLILTSLATTEPLWASFTDTVYALSLASWMTLREKALMTPSSPARLMVPDEPGTTERIRNVPFTDSEFLPGSET